MAPTGMIQLFGGGTLFPKPEWQQDPIQQGGRGNARNVRAHERAASPPFWTNERGFAAPGRFVAAALPRVLDTRTVISCRWDTGGDGHRWIMAKHRVGVETLFLGTFGTTFFVVPDVRWGLKPFYHTLQPVILSQSRYSPSTACHYLHLLEMGGHVCLPSCVSHASIVLSKHLVGVEPLFSLVFWDHGCKTCKICPTKLKPQPAQERNAHLNKYRRQWPLSASLRQNPDTSDVFYVLGGALVRQAHARHLF